ncbi:hypothetical protein CSUI_010244, partial [Cystoisospora suis]
GISMELLPLLLRLLPIEFGLSLNRAAAYGFSSLGVQHHHSSISSACAMVPTMMIGTKFLGVVVEG